LKRGFSLIELIFTIVIIALVFTTIPKIIYTTNESFKFSLKEDGIFNMMAKVMDISLAEWDENNTEHYDILITGNSNILECNSSLHPAIRIGGLYSGDLYSRICPHNYKVSHIGIDKFESSEEDFDDVDDFNGTEVNATKNGRARYTLFIQNGYTDEWGKSNYNYNTQTLKFTFNDNFTTKTNEKFTRVILYDRKYDRNISNAKYWSANIGKVAYIESEQW